MMPLVPARMGLVGDAEEADPASGLQGAPVVNVPPAPTRLVVTAEEEVESLPAEVRSDDQTNFPRDAIAEGGYSWVHCGFEREKKPMSACVAISVTLQREKNHARYRN
jgi:hypothetical protein